MAGRLKSQRLLQQVCRSWSWEANSRSGTVVRGFVTGAQENDVVLVGGRPGVAQSRSGSFFIPIRCATSTALAEAEAEEEILFPREGPGASYALNWSLAAAGVPPPGEAYRNLKEGDLKKHGAAEPGAKSGTSSFSTRSQITGATEITEEKFKHLVKEVTSHLSAVSKLFVHDGAVGSYPKADAKLRTIADHPSASLLLRRCLLPTSTRAVSKEDFPFTVYIASQFRSDTLGKAVGDFVAIDVDSSAAILGGQAFADSGAVKGALSALAGPTMLERGALPLSARLLVHGNSTILLFAPEAIAQNSPSILNASVSKDAGVAWSPEGVARLFEPSSEQPNLYKNPASVVFVTADSSGAIPTISKILPSQAAFHFLAGYDGKSFKPAYQLGPSWVDAASLAEKLLAQLISTGASPFLVNASDGDKMISDTELLKLVGATASEKLPKSRVKKASEDAVEILKKKYSDFVSSSFPNLPEGISL